MGRYIAWLRLTSGLLTVACVLPFFCSSARAGTAERVSVSATGAQGNESSRSPSMSADGRSVVFYSEACNLVPGDTNGTHDAFVRDRATGTILRVLVGVRETAARALCRDNESPDTKGCARIAPQ
jgi:Tol biopolymer transport system component